MDPDPGGSFCELGILGAALRRRGRNQSWSLASSSSQPGQPLQIELELWVVEGLERGEAAGCRGGEAGRPLCEIAGASLKGFQKLGGLNNRNGCFQSSRGQKS